MLPFFPSRSDEPRSEGDVHAVVNLSGCQLSRLRAGTRLSPFMHYARIKWLLENRKKRGAARSPDPENQRLSVDATEIRQKWRTRGKEFLKPPIQKKKSYLLSPRYFIYEQTIEKKIIHKHQMSFSTLIVHRLRPRDSRVTREMT